MTTILNDIKYSIRQLMKSPGFTCVAVLTMTLCIAANVVIFAVIDAVLIRSLPFPESERLVIAYHNYPGAGVEHQACSLTSWDEWREAIPAFANVSACQEDSVVIHDAMAQEARRVRCHRVTPGFFTTLGVTPALGRFFTEEEGAPTRGAVAILTDAYWRSHYREDPSVLGRDILVDGQTATIVGVLRPNFRYLSSRARLFFPLTSSPRDRGPYQRHNTSVQVIARLASGASLATAQAQIDALNAQQMEAEPRLAKLLEGTGFHTRIFPLHADHVRTVRPVLLLLQGGALFLFAIGGVNLVNLLLIKASSRVKEFSVRQALGASRGRIICSVLVENLLLTGIGGVFGLGLGAAGLALLSTLGTSQLPLGTQITFTGRLAATTLGGTIAAGIIFAIPTIIFHLSKHLAFTLHSEGRSGTASLITQRLRHGFVVAQITLAFLLLTGAGLLGASLKQILSVPTGFQSTQVLSARLMLPSTQYSNESARLAFVERLLRELRTQPSVTSAAVSTVVPFTGQDNNQVIVAEGVAPQPGDSLRAHFHCAVTGEFWQTLDIPLRQGRLLEEADNHRKERVCVVDETFAQRYWPNDNAIGYRVTKGPVFNAETAFRIVGIVGSIKQDRLEESDLGAVYFPYRYDARDNLYIVTRSSLPPLNMVSIVRQIVQNLDPGIPVDDIQTMQARIDTSLIQRRSPALLAGIFAAVALSLTVLGTYGVVAYAVAQRKREIGVRMALGAQPQQVLNHFLGISVKLLLTGLILGLLGTWPLGHVMENLLFGVSVLHPGVLGATAGVMIVVVLLTCLIPARRAAKIDPMEALRYE
jgi:predicted permease